MSPTLQYTKVNYIKRDLCNGIKSYNGHITQGMICAGFMSGKTDSCTGDSGGPLILLSKSKGSTTAYQVGIASWSYGCARPNYPGVYTNVYKYRDWINAQINKDPVN